MEGALSNQALTDLTNIIRLESLGAREAALRRWHRDFVAVAGSTTTMDNMTFYAAPKDALLNIRASLERSAKRGAMNLIEKDETLWEKETRPLLSFDAEQTDYMVSVLRRRRK